MGMNAVMREGMRGRFARSSDMGCFSLLLCVCVYVYV